MLLYALSPLLTWRIDPRMPVGEDRTKPVRAH